MLRDDWCIHRYIFHLRWLATRLLRGKEQLGSLNQAIWWNNIVIQLIGEVEFNFDVRFLALICIVKAENYDRPFLIDFNIEIFRNGLTKLLNMKDHMKWFNIFIIDWKGTRNMYITLSI